MNTLYHVTPLKNLESILRTGLDPSYAGDGKIYLAEQEKTSLAYARQWQNDPDGLYVLLEIDPTMLDSTLLQKESREIGESVKEFYSYTALIPPQAIPMPMRYQFPTSSQQL